MNPYEPPNMFSSGLTWWDRFLGQKPILANEPQRLLDDIANVVHRVRIDLAYENHIGWFCTRPRVKRKLTRSLLLSDQFAPNTAKEYWTVLWQRLECPAPREFLDGCTIQDVVDHICNAGRLGDRLPPGQVTSQLWINAQVFAGVQQIVIESLGVSKEQVYRSAHFVDDLQCC